MPASSTALLFSVNLLYMLFSRFTYKEGWARNELLTNSDEALPNEDSCFVVRFNILFGDDRLQTSVQQILNLQCEHIIEFTFITIEDTEDM